MNRIENARVLTEQEQRRQERAARARALIRGRLPEYVDGDGRVCCWAVWAVLELWGRHGEGAVRPSQVRQRREQRVNATRERLGWDPWTQEAA